MPIQCFVDIWKTQWRFQGADAGYAGKPPGRSLKNKANHERAFKQKRYKQKAFNSHLDSTAYSQLAYMLVGEV